MTGRQAELNRALLAGGRVEGVGANDEIRTTRERSSQKTEVEGVVNRVQEVETRTRSAVRTDIEASPSEGVAALRIVEFGAMKFFWSCTGTVDSGATKLVPLTENRMLGGVGLFEAAPMASVYRNNAVEFPTMGRAGRPNKSNMEYSVRSDMAESVAFSVLWHQGSESWVVEVENSTGSAADFLVVAQGV